MNPRTFIAATLLSALAVPVLPPLEAQACYKYNPFCRNPVIRRTIKNVEKEAVRQRDNVNKEWVRQRDNVTDQFSGHICKQNLLSAKRRAHGPMRNRRIDKALDWIRASGAFQDVDLNRLEFRLVDLINASMMTHGHTIYIDTNFWYRRFIKSETDLARTIAHELGHVRQYKHYGSTEKFCRAYEKNVASHGNFTSMHQMGSMETDAGMAELTFLRWLSKTGVSQRARERNESFRSFTAHYARNASRIFTLPHDLPSVAEWRRWEEERLVENQQPIFFEPPYRPQLPPYRPQTLPARPRPTIAPPGTFNQ